MNHRLQAGFTLVEVMVAVVIFAIGMLGIASLQVNGLRFTHTSYQRSQAVLLAQDLAEMMRANASAMQGGSNLYLVDIGGIDRNALVDCGIDSCNFRERAEHDLVTWLETVETALGDGTGRACLDATPNDGDRTDWSCDGGSDNIVIKLQWAEQRARGDDSIEAQFLYLNLGEQL